MVPDNTLTMHDNNEDRKELTMHGDNDEEGEVQKWDKFPSDLLEHISDRLPLSSLLNFRFVCTAWRSAPSGRSLITQFPRKTPWLVVYDSTTTATTTTTLTLYHPSLPLICSFPLPSLQGSTCIVSKHGWLLAHNNGSLILCNPLSLSTIKLPNHPSISNPKIAKACTFCYLPDTPHCMVVMVSTTNHSSLQISSIRPYSQHDWNSQDVQHDVGQLGAIKMARCCNCTDFNGCKCMYKNWFCAYDSSLNCLVYNIIYQYWKISKCTKPSLDDSLSLEEVVSCHGKEMRRRIGKQARSLSTCVLEKNSEYLSCTHCQRAYFGEEKDEGEDGKVKAAWIEPRW